MKKLALFPLLALAACSNESNLGNTLNGGDIDAALPSGDIPDAETYTPDANPPSTFASWSAESHLMPEQACTAWTFAHDGATDPALGDTELTLTAATGETVTYAQSGTDLDPIVPDKIRFSVRVRLVDGEARMMFRYHGLTDGLRIADGVVTADDGVSIVAPTTDAVHAYELYVDLWTAHVILRVDGTEVASATAANAGAGEIETIEFGQAAPGSSAWQSANHDVHAITDCPWSF